ncbi:MAG TPA: type II toxin-antitoxin system VapC family toxin [Acidimicrobiales bacterium]
MNLLLDTHVLLWWLSDDPALPRWAASPIADPDNAVLVSAASVWEISIKRAVGRLEAPDDLLDVLDDEFDTLSMTVSHAMAAGQLPAHHADPFDRMLIAQARIEGLTLVSVDRRFGEYDVPLLAAG